MHAAIILEGADCVGKTTVARAIQYYARDLGHRSVYKHSTNTLRTSFDDFLDFDRRGRLDDIEFHIFDRVDCISGLAYSAKRNRSAKMITATQRLLQQHFQYATVFFLLSDEAFNRWRNRVLRGQEFVTDALEFRKILAAYESAAQALSYTRGFKAVRTDKLDADRAALGIIHTSLARLALGD